MSHVSRNFCLVSLPSLLSSFHSLYVCTTPTSFFDALIILLWPSFNRYKSIMMDIQHEYDFLCSHFSILKPHSSLPINDQRSTINKINPSVLIDFTYYLAELMCHSQKITSTGQYSIVHYIAVVST
jgi:hypothetical protein